MEEEGWEHSVLTTYTVGKQRSSGKCVREGAQGIFCVLRLSRDDSNVFVDESP